VWRHTGDKREAVHFSVCLNVQPDEFETGQLR